MLTMNFYCMLLGGVWRKTSFPHTLYCTVKLGLFSSEGQWAKCQQNVTLGRMGWVEEGGEVAHGKETCHFCISSKPRMSWSPANWFQGTL